MRKDDDPQNQNQDMGVGIGIPDTKSSGGSLEGPCLCSESGCLAYI